MDILCNLELYRIQRKPHLGLAKVGLDNGVVLFSCCVNCGILLNCNLFIVETYSFQTGTGTIISGEQNREKSQKTSHFTIPRVSRETSGLYICSLTIEIDFEIPCT